MSEERTCETCKHGYVIGFDPEAPIHCKIGGCSWGDGWEADDESV